MRPAVMPADPEHELMAAREAGAKKIKELEEWFAVLRKSCDGARHVKERAAAGNRAAVGKAEDGQSLSSG